MIRLIKEILIAGSGILALIYLMLPSPLLDIIPFIGWLDEGAATITLINCLNYYGLDLTNLYGRRITGGKKRVVRKVRRKPDHEDLEPTPPEKPKRRLRDLYEEDSPIRYD